MEFDVFALCIKFLFTHRRCTSTDADNDELCPYDGEQIYDGPNHYFGRGFLCSFYDDEPYDNIFRIPMMIWMSPTFSARHSDVAERLRNAVDRQFCSDDLPFLIYDLADIDFNYNDKSRSLISDIYTPHKTVIVEYLNGLLNEFVKRNEFVRINNICHKTAAKIEKYLLSLHFEKVTR